LLSLLVLGALAPTQLAARQQPLVLAGHVVDLQGKPVAGQEVLLHRVAGESGASIGQTQTDSTGAFTFRLDETPTDDAVYFAAARVDGKMYIGPFQKPPIDSAAPYEIVVGGEPIDFGAPLTPGTPTPGSALQSPVGPSRWTLALIPLLAVLGLGAAIALSRRRRLQRRHLLIRLAVLEEQAAQNGDTEGLRQERARILDQLGGALGG
jgi:hypothetical protein